MAPANGPFHPPWTTLQAGRIQGGVARNVIAGHCELEWEMRPVRIADADLVKRHLESFCAEVLLPEMRRVSPEAEIRTLTVGEVAGLEPAGESEARAIVSALTGEETADVVSFGTEAGLFQAHGVSTVVCGPGSIAQAHKPDEYSSHRPVAGLPRHAGRPCRPAHLKGPECPAPPRSDDSRRRAPRRRGSPASITRLRDRICLLDYPPGTKLSEEALAAEFGISRTPLRRVLGRLELQGLLVSVQGVGTIVTDADIEALSQVYQLRMELAEMIGRLSPVSPEDAPVAEMQAILRARAARWSPGPSRAASPC